jgi:hypothetical protein
LILLLHQPDASCITGINPFFNPGISTQAGYFGVVSGRVLFIPFAGIIKLVLHHTGKGCSTFFGNK